ncbi:MAG TPA: putative Ig domain-containing protein, partial [Blastocatellia bacterium]|nr:putative Ig domain-containing protein [Blastocatellia bacterium]
RLGDGAGNFSGSTNVSVGAFPQSVTVGDFNGDGKLDFATANQSDNTVSIRLGDGAGNFSGSTNVSVGSVPRSVAVGDFNGDGKLDFAAAGSSANAISIRLNNCTPNTPPTITAGGTFTRQQGSAAGAAVQVATVSDSQTAAGSLTVTATTVPAGITVGSISNTSGTIRATIAADCNATLGNNTVTLTVSDGGLTTTANFTVNVTANTPPTVGTYANTTVATGGGIIVTPSAAPADNCSIAGVTASAPGFTGSFSGNTSTGAVTISNAGPSGTYTVTVTVTDNCGATTQQTFTLTVNAAPTITAGGTFTRQQGSPAGTAVQIATVGDLETAVGSLTVAATTVPTGITVASINNTGGTITATIAAGCNAALGPNTVTLTVTDGGGLTATANFIVNVTANSQPTVGTYGNQALAPGGGIIVTPSAAPADNGSIAGVTASAPGFTGSFSGNTSTGAVTISNAGPSGTYTVTVTVTDNCGATAQQTFTLTVNGAPTLGPIPLSIAQGTTTAVLANVTTVGDAETPLANLNVQISANGTIFGSSATLNGVAVALILPPNGNGLVTANVTTTCAATNATFTLKVTDAGGLSVTAPWTVTVTANTPPTLSYANQAFPAGTTPSFSPSAGPSDNGAVTNIALQSITPSSGLTLTVNPTTGQVTVTGATIAQTYTVVIRATDNCGATTDATFTATLPCPTIALAPTSLPNASVNTAYTQSLSATPAGGNYTFAVTGGLLPQGLTLNANGSFSGAPTQGGTFNFRVTATGFGGCSAFSDYVLTVNCPSLSITTTGLPGGTLGSAYNQTLAVSPAGTYSFAVTSGALPTGLTLNAATGAITGTPTSVGSFAFTVTAGSGGCSASSSFTIAVACAGISLSPATLPGGQAGVAYSQTITVNPAGSYTFSIVQGNLPAGLTLNPSTGVISGLPTVTGTSTFIVKAKAANGCEATGTHTLTLTCPTVTLSPTTLPNGQTGTAYNQSLTVSPTGGNYTFAVSSGSLPAGLTLNPATGVISGTPTANGSSTFTVTATGFGGCTGSSQYTVQIGNGSCQTVTLPATLPNGGLGQLYSNSVGATPTGTYSYTSTGSLPPGVTLYGSIGLLFGYPTAQGTYNFTVTATDANNCTGSKSYSVVIGTGSALAVNDFSGDRRSDFVLWRSSLAQWLIVDSATDAAQSIQWGQAGDRAVPGDFDGDGKADLAAFGKDGHWRVRLSGGGTLDKLWGLGSDVPVPGDYDGDGKADLAVWRGADTNWYILRSSDGQIETKAWGSSLAPYLDIPVPGDFDGDGKTDIAVFRQSNGHWYIRRSSDGTVLDKAWGLGTDVPVAADYDGDGKTDIAVWRGSEGIWYIIQSSDGELKSKFWGASYEPYFDVPA